LRATARLKNNSLMAAGFQRLTVAMMLALAVFFGAAAHANEDQITVAVYPAPPFVMQQNGILTGFSIDLWNDIAAKMQLKTTYQVLGNVEQVEQVLRSHQAQLTVSPIFITHIRSEQFDFSYPVLQTGLRIMVGDTSREATSSNPLMDLLHLLFSETTLVWLGIALLLVLVPAHVVWLLERRHSNGIASRNYVPGIFEAIFWAASTLTTQADVMPRQSLARVVALFWMFAGVVFVSFYTAQLTTSLTMRRMRGGIEGIRDLPGRKVGTMQQSAAVDLLREHNAYVVEYTDTATMFKALLEGNLDAIVWNGPVLRYFASHAGSGQVRLVGAEFDAAPLVILMPLGSPLRKRIDSAFLKLYEDGTYQQLQDKWFGSL
jgi:polar amino acid transport system substrate-binding protein